MSIPRKSTGSVLSGASGTSRVAFKNHMPSRSSRSDSPLRHSASVAGCSGEAVQSTSLTRPATVQTETVQTETVRSGICQDSMRSS